MSFNKLSLSDSSTNSDTSSPEAIQESQVQTPASAISEPDEATMDTSLESMFLTVKTQQNDEIKTSPLLTLPPLETAPPSHYGLLGVDSRAITKAKAAPKDDQEAVLAAPPSLSASRIFHNVAAPSSTFICGSQGSGKSNTLACLLENCLLPNKYGVLPKPLTGIVFHYDGFNSDAGGLICEAACLASDKRIRVRVVCAPTNIKTIRHTYRNVPGVIIEPLQLRDSHLNTSRMLDLMAVGETNVPLYMRVVGRVLRELRLEQQETGGYFNYQKFKSKMDHEDLTDMQRAPLNQRLDTLESFMVQTGNSRHRTNKYAPVTGGNDWTPKAGQLTIVDLSCPCVTAEMACSLFNICLHLFVEGTSPIGRVIALDEAHKYMTMGPESRTLTDNLLGIIRLQRHLGARIIISTQEPTVSPKLLDLCSVTIVHRFTSPDWLRTLQGHLAGVSYMSAGSDESGTPIDEANLYRGAVRPLALGGKNAGMELFAKIVSLRTGEALVFSPSAIIDLRGEGDAQADDIDTKAQVIRLAHRALRVQIRTRLTLDGGRSVMAA
ncbi:hypothetical protein F5X68DRAFT_177017 [Plectosphaerella plurivora]|uniref:P-loop containing nucleoside triphosphate hydrolase protein n=1 Tax=Plectosphaerella plurivora TaxID=936078 RepID=A0A9P9A424_9PEZI|nr:hypothetical protein F5X68DRAFT_177017 [Plectosphaerella plurivora]